jgi:hypothetical protein
LSCHSTIQHIYISSIIYLDIYIHIDYLGQTLTKEASMKAIENERGRVVSNYLTVSDHTKLKLVAKHKGQSMSGLLRVLIRREYDNIKHELDLAS